jgi:hypothetical protein
MYLCRTENLNPSHRVAPSPSEEPAHKQAYTLASTSTQHNHINTPSSSPSEENKEPSDPVATLSLANPAVDGLPPPKYMMQLSSTTFAS